MDIKNCVIVGAGPGNGLAFGRKFRAQGYRVALLARSQSNLSQLQQQLSEAHYYRCDVTQPDQVRDVFARLRGELGPVDTLIYNAGAGAFGSLDDVTADQLEQAWRTNTLGYFCCVKQVVEDMRNAGSGNIVVIGATASLRGGANFAAFSSAKGAQRNLVQSTARHLDRQGIHVAYIIIDGVIDLQRTRERFAEKPDEFFLQSDHIAETVYHVTQQQPSAWTFELDLRPFKESW